MMYALIGLLAGLTSGIGLGGGIILIPALTIIYAMPQQQAQSINLLYFLPTALIAIITHLKAGNIEKNLVPPIVAFGVASCIVGSLIAVNTDPTLLKKMFGYFFLLMGFNEFFKGNKKVQGQP